MKTLNKLITAALTLALGILFVVKQGGILEIIMTVFGVFAIVLGVIDIVQKNTVSGIVKIVLGAVAIVFGWVFTKVATIVVGVLLAVYGLLLLIDAIRAKSRILPKILAIVVAGLYILCGIGLAFGQLLNVIFLIMGILLIVDGVIALVGALVKK